MSSSESKPISQLIRKDVTDVEDDHSSKSSSESQPISQLIRKDVTDVEDDESSKIVEFSGALCTMMMATGVQQTWSDGQDLGGSEAKPESFIIKTRLKPFYDAFFIEVVAGASRRYWLEISSNGSIKQLDDEPLDKLWAMRAESNLSQTSYFSWDNKLFDIYARDPCSALIPSKKYQLYLRVCLYFNSGGWKFPLEVRGVGVSDLVPCSTAPAFSPATMVWQNVVVAEFTAAFAKVLTFRICDGRTTGQNIGGFYLGGFGHLPV